MRFWCWLLFGHRWLKTPVSDDLEVWVCQRCRRYLEEWHLGDVA